MTTIEARRALLKDIQRFHSVEVNTDHLLAEVFNEVIIPDWCQAVGVTYRINSNPDPSFKSKTTVIFQDIICKDDEL